MVYTIDSGLLEQVSFIDWLYFFNNYFGFLFSLNKPWFGDITVFQCFLQIMLQYCFVLISRHW